ncbi:hypothetical protein GCM10010172_49200 [Paractinoplanes ferrugineus]|uniref:Uncharacterized protein n=1 Tax=Paractinoplanes ferrugineus TaxID=113564 RepID=A0A919J7T6_9ACTN|nr:hypothetical protein Afe05nite_79750 [Actinoplanes ferrugineus]
MARSNWVASCAGGTGAPWEPGPFELGSVSGVNGWATGPPQRSALKLLSKRVGATPTNKTYTTDLKARSV